MKNFITTLHQSTSRNYIERMNNDKIECMIEAKKYGENYWDGDRKFGYGGYKYIPGRWKPLAEKLIETYNLKPNSKILDVGCGKGFMIFDFIKLIPDLRIEGIDISNYAIKHSKEEVSSLLKVGDAMKLPYKDKSFDYIISINTIHNLDLEECKTSIKEINRVSKKGAFITVDAYNNEDEKKRMYAWNLTAKTIMSTNEWKRLFKECKYEGDFYWFIP